MTHTFISLGNEYQFTVKEEFLNRCPVPENVNVRELITVFKLTHFLENYNGFALIRLRDRICECWVDGKCLMQVKLEKRGE